MKRSSSSTAGTHTPHTPWPQVRLGDVCVNDILRLKSISVDVIDYVDISSVDNVRKSITGYKTYSVSEAPGRAQQVVCRGDVLVSTVRPNLNAVALVQDLGSHNQLIASTGFSVLRCNEKLDSRYLFFYTQTDYFIKPLMAVSEKAAYPSVTDKIVRESVIPLPPLDEQRAIVARLEKELDEADRLAAAFQRMVVLAEESFRSELEEAFREISHAENAENAEASNSSAPSALSAREKEISHGGPMTRRLEEVCDEITDGDHQPPPKVASGVPFLVISNVASGRISFEGTRHVPQSYFDAISEKRKPRKGDVLLTVTGSYGIPLMVDTDKPFCFQRHIALLRTSRIVQKYLLYFLMASKGYFDRVATGAAQKTVSLSSIRKLEIPVLSLAVQRAVVARLDAARVRADALKAAAERGVALAAELRRSVLAEAFR